MAATDQALQILEWYRLRWRIERLVSAAQDPGCRVEALQRAVTLRAVGTERLTALTRLGRNTPELPIETTLTVLRKPDLE